MVSSARDVLFYLVSEAESWGQDVDGSDDRPSHYHDIRISNGVLEDLLDMAGIEQGRLGESALSRLKRANELDLKRIA